MATPKRVTNEVLDVKLEGVSGRLSTFESAMTRMADSVTRLAGFEGRVTEFLTGQAGRKEDEDRREARLQTLEIKIGPLMEMRTLALGALIGIASIAGNQFYQSWQQTSTNNAIVANGTKASKASDKAAELLATPQAQRPQVLDGNK